MTNELSNSAGKGTKKEFMKKGEVFAVFKESFLDTLARSSVVLALTALIGVGTYYLFVTIFRACNETILGLCLAILAVAAIYVVLFALVSAAVSTIKSIQECRKAKAAEEK